MISVSDIIKLLEHIPLWKTLSTLPGRLESLEKRVSELEKLKNPDKTGNSFNTCPKCRNQSFELVSSRPHPLFGDVGTREHLYRCSLCGWEEPKTVD